MKLGKLSAIVLCLLLLAGMLGGCAAKTGNLSASDDYFVESAGSGFLETASTPAAKPASEATLTERKLIKTVELEAETEDLDALLTALSARIGELGGYVESQQVYNGSAYSTRYSRNASLTIRIPAESLDGFVDHVAGSTNIVSNHAYIDDVTLTYVATESRVNALLTEEARLLELMGQAENMSDLLEIEARLTDVRYELESVTSQLNVLENQVSYSTVYLSVDEVQQYTPAAEESFWQRVSGGFADSLRSIGDGVVELTVFVLVKLPYLVLIAAAGAVLFLLIRHNYRKKKGRKAQQDQQ